MPAASRNPGKGVPIVGKTKAMKHDYDVAIIGAGAAGVGIAHVFKTLGMKRFTILERHEVGASFLRWPREMRFISPSFTGNAFGLLDLNAVTPETSPAFTLEAEHPSGQQYAQYLNLIVEHYRLPVKTGVEVISIEKAGFTPKKRGAAEHSGFIIKTQDTSLSARFVVWAAGEFQYPHRRGFSGSELCLHNSTISSWHTLSKGTPGSPRNQDARTELSDKADANHFIVIGGNESGIDAAINLSRNGKTVTVLDRGRAWESSGSDPSNTLAPYTHERLRRALTANRIELVGKARVNSVVHKDGLYTVRATVKKWTSVNPPILATGFAGSLTLVETLFAWLDDGYVELTESDESTLTPGLFVAGPLVRHEGSVFCFIYKFRQRFAVVAKAIAERLGVDTEPLEQYRKKQMFLDDLSCCEEECAC